MVDLPPFLVYFSAYVSLGVFASLAWMWKITRADISTDFSWNTFVFLQKSKLILLENWIWNILCHCGCCRCCFLIEIRQRSQSNANSSLCQLLSRDWPQISLTWNATQLCGLDHVNIISESSARFYILNQWEAEAIESFLYLMKFSIVWGYDPGNT